MAIHLKTAAQTVGSTVAAGAFATAAVLAPGIVADALSPVPAQTTVRDIGISAVLPDRTVGGFVSAALDGSGQTSRVGAAVSGIGQDFFEWVTSPGKAVVVALR